MVYDLLFLMEIPIVVVSPKIRVIWLNNLKLIIWGLKTKKNSYGGSYWRIVFDNYIW